MSDWITDRDTTLQILTRIYTAGYQRGHDETVESTYLLIHPNDVGTYFSDDVTELMQALPHEATALLIAAAPELLEAATNVRWWWDGGNKISPKLSDIIGRLRAAIAKAKGAQP